MAAMRRWFLLAAAVAAVSAVFTLVRLPTPFLFGGLAGALAYALVRPAQPLRLPGAWFTGGQAVVGAVVGASVVWESLVALGPSWLAVVVVSCFSLAVSVLVGSVAARCPVVRQQRRGVTAARERQHQTVAHALPALELRRVAADGLEARRRC